MLLYSTFAALLLVGSFYLLFAAQARYDPSCLPKTRRPAAASASLNGGGGGDPGLSKALLDDDQLVGAEAGASTSSDDASKDATLFSNQVSTTPAQTRSLTPVQQHDSADMGGLPPRGRGQALTPRSSTPPIPHQDNPENRAGPLSTLYFLWMTPLVRLGYKRPLDETDLWRLHPTDEPTHLQAVFNQRSSRFSGFNRINP